MIVGRRCGGWGCVAVVNRFDWDVHLLKLYMHVRVKSELCTDIILKDGALGTLGARAGS